MTSSHLSSSYNYSRFDKLTATQSATYNFDANGNTIEKAEGSNYWRYIFDHEDKVSSASTRRQTVRYVYDALGRRVRRHITGQKETTKYTYDGQDVILDDDSGIRTKYQNGPGVDNKLRQTVGSNVSYFLGDHLNTTNGLASSSGTVTASNSYDSFGNPTNTNFPSRYQFTGREFDSFTSLQYSRARFYDPKLGRFISEDPIGFGGGDVNLYGYVWNNPAAFTDPLGLDGYGNDLADRLDAYIDYARLAYQGGVQDWQRNGSINTIADLSRGVVDSLRVGSGVGNAIYDPNASGWQRAGNVANDALRAAAIAAIVARGATTAVSALSRFGAPAAEIEACAIRPFNPFKGKTAVEINDMLRKRGFTTSGSDPAGGPGGYINPKSGRSYHIDPKDWGRYREPNHVDVNRLKSYKGPIKKRKFDYQD